METIAEIPVLSTLLLTILPFLVVLGIVVFVHEYGHYIVGKWMGIKAEVFSIGFGPTLFGWTDKAGTFWQVAALPLGGFVKFTGDMDPASAGQKADAELTVEDRAWAFHNAPLGARALTVAAGPVFNFILAAVLIALLAMTIGRPVDDPVLGSVDDRVAEAGLREGDRVLSIDDKPVKTFWDVMAALGRMDGQPVPVTVEREGVERQIDVSYTARPVISNVFPGDPADQAGMEVGDVVLSINGRPVETYYDLRVISIEGETGEPIEVRVARGDDEITFSLVPEMMERPHPVTGEVMELPTMGIAGGVEGLEQHREVVGLLEALPYGAKRTWDILYGTVDYLGQIIAGQADASQLGGPIGIAQISGEAFAAGVASMIWLIAVISASIGLINLFPIPVLDGGHLMFYTLEALRGRPVGESAMRIGNVIGLSLVLLLMVFATYNDLLRI